MRFLGLQDLEKRWPCYTRQGVHKLSRSAGFPAPAFSVNAGRTKIWDAADVVSFEATHPEVSDDQAKRFKMKGFARAVQKGQRRK